MIQTLLLFVIAALVEHGPDPSRPLACLSMRAARALATSGIARNSVLEYLAGITRPYAMVMDSTGDVIVVGERDTLAPFLSLDDLIIAFRTSDSLQVERCPGVSIDAPDDTDDPDSQCVHYFGGIEGTRYGLVCFLADLLLKQLSMGLVPTGLSGVPNEWDLMLHCVKKDGYLRSETEEPGRSWFFPSLVRVASCVGCAVLHACKIEVLTDDGAGQDSLGVIRRRSPELEPAGRAFARSVSDNFDVIARRHPVLSAFRSLIVLSALAKVVRSDSCSQSLVQWLKTCDVRRVTTPPRIGSLRREVGGLAYGLYTSGGVAMSATAYRASAGLPSAVRDVVLSSRPSADALMWTIDLAGSPVAPMAFSDSARTQAELRLLDSFLQAGRRTLGDSVTPGFSVADRIPRVSAAQVSSKVETPGWRPSTWGGDVIESSALVEAELGYGMAVFDGRWYGVGVAGLGRQVHVGLPVKHSLVFKNRLEGAVFVPLDLSISQVVVPESGDSSKAAYTTVGLLGEISSVSLSASFLLLKGGRRKPALAFNTLVETPISCKLFEWYSLPVPIRYRPRFADTTWRMTPGLSAEFPLSARVSVPVQSQWEHGFAKGDSECFSLLMGIRRSAPRFPGMSNVGPAVFLEQNVSVPASECALGETDTRLMFEFERSYREGPAPSILLAIGLRSQKGALAPYFFASYGIKHDLLMRRKWF
jgi:hypothetical protein